MKKENFVRAGEYFTRFIAALAAFCGLNLLLEWQVFGEHDLIVGVVVCVFFLALKAIFFPRNR